MIGIEGDRQLCRACPEVGFDPLQLVRAVAVAAVEFAGHAAGGVVSGPSAKDRIEAQPAAQGLGIEVEAGRDQNQRMTGGAVSLYRLKRAGAQAAAEHTIQKRLGPRLEPTAWYAAEDSAQEGRLEPGIAAPASDVAEDGQGQERGARPPLGVARKEPEQISEICVPTGNGAVEIEQSDGGVVHGWSDARGARPEGKAAIEHEVDRHDDANGDHLARQIIDPETARQRPEQQRVEGHGT